MIKKKRNKVRVAREIVISKPKVDVDYGYSVLPDPKYFMVKQKFIARVQKGEPRVYDVKDFLLNRKEVRKIWPLMKSWARKVKR